jgi:hypothetical protein
MANLIPKILLQTILLLSLIISALQSKFESNNSTNTKLSLQYCSTSKICAFTIAPWNRFCFIKAFFNSLYETNSQCIRCLVWIILGN